MTAPNQMDARPALPPLAARVFYAFGGLMAITLVLLRHVPLAAAPVAVTGIAAAIASVVGLRLNRPQVTLPWAMFAFACTAFIAGAMLRQVLSGGALEPLADVASMSGYVATSIGFVGLLRCRQSRSNSVHETVDAGIVLVAVGAVAIAWFAIPTVERQGLSLYSVVQGAYPVVDSVLVFVVILLSWTSARRMTSFWLLGLSIGAVLVGDVGYAIIATRGQLVGSPLLDLPFVVGFTFFGAAALHPSMRELSSVQQRPVQAWSFGRMAILVPLMLVPALVALLGNHSVAGWVGVLAMVVTTLLLLMRALTAVRDHAQAAEGLRHQASHDQLTGLANRSRLVEVVDALLMRSRRDGGTVDVLFLDLDSFKLVNDTWGHQVGDRLLRSSAARLLEVTYDTDTVARIGGDEFVVARYVGLHGGASGEDLAARIVDAFRAALPGDDALVTSVSVGLAGSARHPGMPGSVSAESLLRDADTAMYRAKAAGRSRCVVFDPAMHDSVRHRVETELALRHALERREFELHYQPIVALDTGEVVGAEALLRWAHPSRGLVSPLDFIPIAEETGLIVEIGQWVISESLRQAARWRSLRPHGPDLWVSVNVSARQLRDESVVDHVAAELVRHDVPAELLILEITESAMMSDTDLASGLLHRLRGLGVTLAVDDFGTGYSSLGHLRRFPVSKVKIDRAFVNGIEHDADDAEIVRAVVAMSLAMRLEVVAEGIETEGQRDLLHRLGVQLGQGWHFGRPAPAEQCTFVTAAPTLAGVSALSRPV